MFFFLFISMFPVTLDNMYNKDPCEDDLFIYKRVIALFTNVFILLSLLCTLLTLSSFILSLVMKTHNELRLIFIRPAR